MPTRIAGTVEVQYNGTVLKMIGNVSYNLGRPKREGLVGHDSVHGYSEMPQIPFIEGEARIVQGMKVKDICDITEATVTAKLATGKIIMLEEAYYASEGTAGSETANLPFRFEGAAAEEVGG